MDMQSITFPGLDEKYGIAPGGYGLGMSSSQMPSISTREQADALVRAGWYEYYNGDGVTCCGYAGTQYGGILVIPSMWSTTQFFFCRQFYGGYLKRIRTNSEAWEPWEWINPPMLLGIEYRTTERCNGKPVYAKAVDCGNFPASAEKVIAHGIADINQIVSCNGFTNNVGLALPYYSHTSEDNVLHNMAAVYATRNEVNVTATVGTWTSYKCYTHLKYTKTTD